MDPEEQRLYNIVVLATRTVQIPACPENPKATDGHVYSEISFVEQVYASSTLEAKAILQNKYLKVFQGGKHRFTVDCEVARRPTVSKFNKDKRDFEKHLLD